jgi:hypothetical protein
MLDEYEASRLAAFHAGHTDPYSPEAQAHNGRRGAALHFLLVAVRNLVKALEQWPDGPRLDPGLKKAAKQLRDLYEHWEKERGRFDTDHPGSTGKDFQKAFPEGHPWTMQWNPSDGSTIGRVLRLDELRVDLDRIERESEPGA